MRARRSMPAVPEMRSLEPDDEVLADGEVGEEAVDAVAGT